ncbi:transposase [Streptomyces mirabilis]|uniref:transposase n=1 Tax=Streptomyces mirabilis TaxID=68239 RepID=UPI003673BE84
MAFTAVMLPAASDNGRTDPRQLTPHSFPESAGGPEKDASDVASFAALCGVSPVERSSGRRQFRRLNRGGDRQANAALHRIVFSRLRVDPRTQDYYERRIKEGKTRREIVRCLKRYAAREVFHLVKQLQPAPRS